MGALLGRHHPPDRRPSYQLVEDLQARLHNDPRVTTDAVTGRRLDAPPYSRRYLELLASRPGFTSDVATPPRIPMSGFQYGPPDLVVGQKAFSLGRKPDSTAYALFGLAAGKQLPELSWDLHVYEELGVVTVCSGGNHRSLACLLWGEHRVPLGQVTWTRKTGFASERSREAMAFDEALQPNGLIRLSESSDLAELLELFDGTTPTERQQLGRYYGNFDFERLWSGADSGPSPALREVRSGLDALRAMAHHESEHFLFEFCRRRVRADLLRRHRILECQDSFSVSADPLPHPVR
ncbi:MAG: hypothetical protein ACOZQL_41505 [Myxococcota bacterium]